VTSGNLLAFCTTNCSLGREVSAAVQASAGRICSREASAAAPQASEGRSSGSNASAAEQASTAGLR
jgi:hypothetical protein